MTDFASKQLPDQPDVTAPDGADVRVLLGLSGGTMAHFEIAPGTVTIAVAHRTVEEIWYILRGTGQMWLKQGDREEVIELHEGVCLTIPLETHFQFRAAGDGPMSAVAITMPPWPGPDEAFPVDGKWTATIS